jgi:hypothetical protein
MLKQLTRSFVAAVALFVVFAGSSALGARSTRPATRRARAYASHTGRAARRIHQKPGVVVHHRTSRKAAAASSVLLGDDIVESQSDFLAAGRAEAFSLRAGASGVARTVHVYIGAANAATTLIVGLYSDVDGHAGARLRTAAASVSDAGTWTTLRISRLRLVSGTTYWLAILGEGGTLRYRDRAEGSCVSETSAQSSLRRLPRAWKSGTAYADCPVSAYVTTAAPPPINTTPPALAGEATAGQVLSATTGNWKETPTSYAYQWQECDALGIGCLNVGGATASSFMLTPADVGGTVRNVVTASNEGGSTPAASEPSEPIVLPPPPAPTNTVAPTVSGTAQVGGTLTASSGTWTESPTSFEYQWEDCNTSGKDCSNVSGAIASSYQLASSDVGDTLRVEVTASNEGGSASSASEASETVAPEPPPPAPTNTVAPTVSGIAQVGQTLTASAGTWSGSPTSFAYQWQDCSSSGKSCSNVSGATAPGYQLASSDAGHTVRVVVTASNEGGATAADSAVTGTVVSSEPPPPAPTNTVLPSVGGSAVEGQTLSASTGTWTGSPTSYAYQWEDCDTAGESCSNIGGATSATYKLASGDVGHTVRVVVTASNAGGSTPASSAAMAVVVPLPPANMVLPSVSGSVVEGQTLGASTGTWTGSPTSYAYRWEDCNTAGGSCSNVSGAISSSYKLAAGDVGHTVRVVVTASNAGGSTPASSAATVTVVPPAPANTVLPSVSGSAVEGETLSASSGTWTGSPTSYAYQWEDCNSVGESCSTIAGATSATYKLGSGDVGHTVRVVVSASNAGGSTKASSVATAAVVPLPPSNTVLPSVSGLVVEGQTLSASTGSWTGSPTSFAHQWEDCNSVGESCSTITGATSATYKLASGDVGHTVRVVVTASNAGGATQASSAATAIVTSVPSAPTNTVLPSVSGSAVEGETLSASSGSWTGSPTSYAYQWEDCSSAGESCSNIGGATSATYKLGSGDVAHTVRVVVTASNAGGSTKASSAATAAVVPLPPSNSALPSVSGSAVEGETLSASSGTWTGSPTSYAHQWEDCNSAGESCSNIGGATSATYKLGSGDVGHTVRVVVTASNAGGATQASSAATAIVTSAPSAPTNTVLPSVSGSAVEGQTLSASTGSWTESPTSYAHQWEDCNSAGESCSNIGGATSATYKLGSGDVGHTVRVAVTASNAGGSTKATSTASESVTSPAYRTFYISYTSGSESNTGTSESSPWKRAPGMHEFSATYAHKAGDHFVFEGGVTWPNSALPLAPPEGREGSGEPSRPDVYGVNESWYAGASYKAPIFDAEGKEVTNGCSHERCGEYNTFVFLKDDDYITVEGIHFIGWESTSAHHGYGTCGVIYFENKEDEHEYEADEHITINKVLINEFKVGDKIEEGSDHEEPNKNAEEPRCAAIVGRAGQYPSPEGESLVENSTIEGAAPSEKSKYGGSFIEGIRNVPNAINNKLWGMNNMYFPGGGGGVIAGNHFENCGYPQFPEDYKGVDHANVMEFADTEAERIAGKPFYIYDNVINGSGDNAGEGGETQCEASFLGRGTIYMWDNVYMHVEGNPPELEGEENAVGKDYFWNNTFEASDLGSGHCLDTGHPGELTEIVVTNNLCVGEELTPSGTHTLKAKTLTEKDDLVAESSELEADHYRSVTESFPFEPTSGAAMGAGKGENLHSRCTGALEQLCYDTDFAGARDPVERLSEGNWNIGAY